MNNNAYLLNVLRRKRDTIKYRQQRFEIAKQLYPHIREWASQYEDPLLRITPSGSYAKSTSIKGATDVDLLVSLKNQVSDPLKEIYDSLYDYFHNSLKLLTRKQNVSIRVIYKGIKIDLVPAKRMAGVTYRHSLYVSRKGTWTITNIQKQISVVKKSGRQREIILMKIWRDLRRLEFPSFYLELSVIEALKGRRTLHLEERITAVLEYLRDRFLSARVVDPANLQNVISDNLNKEEKVKICLAAKNSLNELYWERIIWGVYARTSI